MICHARAVAVCICLSLVINM